MKKIIFIFLGTLIPFLAKTQTVLPQAIPCIEITQTNLPVLGNGIEATDCIVTDDSVTFLQNEHYSIKAGEYISFGQNTVIDPDASHQFHAYIDNGGMEVAWYYPNSTPGTVGQFEKLELGVEFDTDIDTQIQNFVNEISGSQLNPFNPEDLDLYAEFWWYNDSTIYQALPIGWYGPYRINGFYYEDFVRNVTDWTEQTNLHDFRLRFAPRMLGLWKCAITANVTGFGTFHATDFTFNCVPSDSKDFMSIGENGRYYKIGDEPFFPVGHNLSNPRTMGTDESAYNPLVPPSHFLAYHDQMETLKENGGNYVRLINSPFATDIEFEKLNDYSDRMIHAWELDNIFEKAGELEILVHFNLQLHNAFAVPYAYNLWDWPAYGDPWNYNDCANPADEGYCYRSELGLIDPIDFFTDTTAIKFYQYKLRYIIARWGHSNDIGVLELFSEINNAGKISAKEVVGLQCVDTLVISPYKADAAIVCPIIADWQDEMCRYIKEDLQHINHPLAVSYGGESDMGNGDVSYLSPYVDIITYNHYELLVEKNYKTVDYVHEYAFIGKPFMFSEYGVADSTYQCDNGVDFIKTLSLTPFSGAAGAGMNWNFQYPGEENLWNHMEPIRTLMEDIPLDEENWQVELPILSSNKGVEVLYLRNYVTDNYRAVGAVSNRTYNHYTQATGSPCNQISLELDTTLIYQNDQNFEHPIGTETLIIPDMGDEVEYKINWYNALTGTSLGTGLNSSYANENFPLYFPEVSGDETHPILFFEIYRADEASFKSVIQDSVTEYREVVDLQKINVDSSNTVTTNWDQATNADIQFYPNPTSDIFNLKIYSDLLLGSTWQICNALGQELQRGILNDYTMSIDLTNYTDGIYLFKLISNNIAYEYKIIKS